MKTISVRLTNMVNQGRNIPSFQKGVVVMYGNHGFTGIHQAPGIS